MLHTPFFSFRKQSQSISLRNDVIYIENDREELKIKKLYTKIIVFCKVMVSIYFLFDATYFIY